MAKTLDQCKTANPSLKLHTVSVDGVEFVYRKPTRQEWTQYRVDANDAVKIQGSTKEYFAAQEDLAKVCTLSHDPVELEALADEDYQLFERLFDVISDLVAKKAAAEGK